MLPLGDDNADRQRWPVVTAILVATNVAVFLYELSLGQAGGQRLAQFVTDWGVVPAEVIERKEWPTIFSSMFLHGGWAHLIGNMLYLWVFGDNVEDRLGRVPFVLFYLAAGIAAVGAQVLVDPDSRVPMIGASGAVSGVLGAYLVMFPRKQVHVLLFWSVVSVPAFLVIGFWALLQAFATYGSIVTARATEGGGVAYAAHVGGFVAGLLAALIYRTIAVKQRYG